jgi:hypothetical protein
LPDEDEEKLFSHSANAIKFTFFFPEQEKREMYIIFLIILPLMRKQPIDMQKNFPPKIIKKEKIFSSFSLIIMIFPAFSSPVF